MAQRGFQTSAQFWALLANQISGFGLGTNQKSSSKSFIWKTRQGENNHGVPGDKFNPTIWTDKMRCTNAKVGFQIDDCEFYFWLVAELNSAIWLA